MASAAYLYIVTQYGCNSGAHDMWTPQTQVFASYNVAYDYFLKVAPELEDPWNRVEKSALTIEEYQSYCEAHTAYIIIETRVHTPGYLDGDATCSKRPYGAVFAATTVVH
jgi:hypothetical protein